MVVMQSKTLYVNLRGATGLENIRHLCNKMKVYGVASISEGIYNHSKQKTAVDENGGINPTWNCPMEFTFNEESAAEQILTFQLRCSRKLGDKIIGEVCVPIGELLRIMREANASVAQVSCPVTSTGKLIFMYSLDQITNPPPPPPAAESYVMKTIAGILVNAAVHTAAWFVFN